MDIECYFNVIRCRYHLTDRNCFLVFGWFGKDNPDGNTVEITLDNTVLEQAVDVFDDLPAHSFLRLIGANAQKEYVIRVSLPETLDSYKKLKIYTVSADGEKKHLCLDIPVSKLEEERNQVEYCIDEVSFDKKVPVIRGWAVSASPIQVSLKDENEEEVPFEIAWKLRSDVISAYREKEVAEKCGFVITLEKNDVKSLSLLLSSDGFVTEEKLNIESLRSDWERRERLSYRTIAALKQISNHHYVKTVVQYIRQNGWKRFIIRAAERLTGKGPGSIDYQEWRLQHLPTQQQLQAQREKVFAYQPKFSVVVPLYKTPENYLLEMIRSVQNQTYANWELCLSDGSGKDTPLRDVLTRLMKEDSRIRVFFGDEPLKISENTNVAIQNATGEYLVFMDHDDLLPEDALYECAAAINEYPDIDLLYTDEDKVSMNGKDYFQPHFKSDYNPDLLCSMNYINHLCVVKRSLQQEVGLLRGEFDGAQDYDFVWRCCERAKRIYHIPKVLYHWRAHMDSTAENPESKLYAFEAGKRAVQAHYDRVGLPATVEHGEYLGLYRTTYHWEEKPLVSIIIPNKDHIEDLDQCIQAILKKATYRNFEFIIIENNSTEQETFAYYDRIQKEEPSVHVVYYKGDFNYSKINNFGVQYAKGSYYLLLNNDTELINPSFLEEMLGYCMRPDVGIVGARLFYEDDTVQHAGVVIGIGGIAGHTFLGAARNANGYFSRIICAQDYSAVTAACMMVKKEAFEKAGGLTEALKVAFNDIDFCLKVRRCGYLVVYNPYAELHHYESKSRGYEDTPEKVARFQSEILEFQKRWPEILEKGDPYYNVNLSLNASDFSLR